MQAIYTAAQHRLPVVFVVMRNGEYSILKSFAKLEKTPGVPGLDLPGLDIASIATGFGCRTVNVDTTEKLAHEFTAALHGRRTHRHRGAYQTAGRASGLNAVEERTCLSIPAQRRNRP